MRTAVPTAKAHMTRTPDQYPSHPSAQACPGKVTRSSSISACVWSHRHTEPMHKQFNDLRLQFFQANLLNNPYEILQN